MLHPYSGKLLVTSEGRLTADSPCCDLVGPHILISTLKNDGSVQDVLAVILNGVNIGTIYNNVEHCSGGNFATTDRYTSTNFPSCYGPTVEIPFNAFLTGTNTLRLESIQQGTYYTNLGSLGVFQIVCDGNSWLTLKVYIPGNTLYSFPPGVGNGQTFTFNYP
jgi:hypothetical protein